MYSRFKIRHATFLYRRYNSQPHPTRLPTSRWCRHQELYNSRCFKITRQRAVFCSQMIYIDGDVWWCWVSTAQTRVLNNLQFREHAEVASTSAIFNNRIITRNKATLQTSTRTDVTNNYFYEYDNYGGKKTQYSDTSVNKDNSFRNHIR